MRKTILSLYDYSGNWPSFFAMDSDFRVIQLDIKLGTDILKWEPSRGLKRDGVYGILAGPPCTDFSVSGAQYWPAKDADGRTAHSVKLVMRVLDLVDRLDPHFWMLENPVGRLRQWIGPPVQIDGKCGFDPADYAGYSPKPQRDRYTKKTCLWGHFKLPAKRRLEPIRVCSQGSWIQRLGGKSERTKELRSKTPLGFSRATYLGNR